MSVPTGISSERFGTTGIETNLGALSLASVMFTDRVAIDDKGFKVELSTGRDYIIIITSLLHHYYIIIKIIITSLLNHYYITVTTIILHSSLT